MKEINMKEENIIDEALNMLHELDPQKQEDEEIIIRWIIEQSKLL